MTDIKPEDGGSKKQNYKARKHLKIIDRSLKIIDEFSEFLKLLDLREVDILKVMIVRFMIESINADVGALIENQDGEFFYSEIFVYKRNRIVDEKISTEGSFLKVKGENVQLLECIRRSSIVVSNSPNASSSLLELVDMDIEQMFYVPIQIEDRIKYIVELGLRKPRYVDSDLNTLRILSNIASAIFDNASLFNKAIHDSLTGLYNIYYFKILTLAEIQKVIRTKSKLSLALMDIDRFKHINDTYGHQIGDEAIKFFANIVKRSIRSFVDIPGRYGGDEFIVVFPSTNKNVAFKICERLMENIKFTPFVYGEIKLSLTTSIGISEIDGESVSSTDDKEIFRKLFLEADTALYTSKNTGRNKITLYFEDLGYIEERDV